MFLKGLNNLLFDHSQRNPWKFSHFKKERLFRAERGVRKYFEDIDISNAYTQLDVMVRLYEHQIGWLTAFAYVNNRADTLVPYERWLINWINAWRDDNKYIMNNIHSKRFETYCETVYHAHLIIQQCLKENPTISLSLLARI